MWQRQEADTTLDPIEYSGTEVEQAVEGEGRWFFNPKKTVTKL